MIKSFVFDFGKVLLNHDLLPMLHHYFNGDAVKVEQFYNILSNRYFIDLCDRGIVPFEKMIELAVKKNPEYSDAFMYFRDNYLDEITGEVDGMREVLQQLKSAGYKLYGLTNWSKTIYKVMEKFDIFQMLDGWVISCEEHCIKPEKEIYLRLCEKYNLNPAECIFTDDRVANVEGAKAVGMKGVLFADSEQYLSEVMDILSAEYKD